MVYKISLTLLVVAVGIIGVCYDSTHRMKFEPSIAEQSEVINHQLEIIRQNARAVRSKLRGDSNLMYVGHNPQAGMTSEDGNNK